MGTKRIAGDIDIILSILKKGLQCRIDCAVREFALRQIVPVLLHRRQLPKRKASGGNLSICPAEGREIGTITLIIPAFILVLVLGTAEGEGVLPRILVPQ